MKYNFDKWASHENNGNMKGAWAKDMPAGGIMLSGAEMDYPLPDFITDALSDFARNGLFGFTLPDSDYKNSICNWMQLARQWTVNPDHIVATLGTTFGLSAAIRAFTEKGDGIIIQHPSYGRFDRAMVRNGRKVVSNPLKEENGIYSLDFEDLEQKMSRPENKMLVLVNPHNPTGRVFAKEELEKIAVLASRYNVVVFSDEIFAETTQGTRVTPYAEIDTAMGISCTSLGKTFNLTGVNQANLVIPNDSLREKYSVQKDIDHFGSIDPFFYTLLRAAYTDKGWDWVQQMNAHTLENYSLLQAALKEMPLITASPLEATFVAWLDCCRLGMTDKEIEHFFMDEALLWADWGEEYGPGGSGFVRMNIATTKEKMETALANLKKAYIKKFDR
ncbi:MAG: aminotransferase class I/II-fold pyridoxal phosphate-dependent enzyme [Oscillospiraceae bacterium]|nr:aminotransferase class I/II-fold pyridoxal phosphate-dependent enzyme [Oscillospiraceae bacterium]